MYKVICKCDSSYNYIWHYLVPQKKKKKKKNWHYNYLIWVCDYKRNIDNKQILVYQ